MMATSQWCPLRTDLVIDVPLQPREVTHRIRTQQIIDPANRGELSPGMPEGLATADVEFQGTELGSCVVRAEAAVR